MGSSSPDVRLNSIEIDEPTAEIARENIKFAGMEERIGVLVRSALEVLPRIAREIDQGKTRINLTLPLLTPTKPKC